MGEMATRFHKTFSVTTYYAEGQQQRQLFSILQVPTYGRRCVRSLLRANTPSLFATLQRQRVC
jgi:hypothetical protein